ncbi:MAG TPA: DUF4097 family beta strand repeat-containing protein [Gemmatimonadaceae bacterium]|jgi:DUF4097 and DUF4098 domain-containing protein YvlB
MRRPALRYSLLTFAIVTAAATAAATAGAQNDRAQSDRAQRFMDNCRRDNGGDQERFCDTRTLTVGAVRALTVDGRQNGGINVHGWDRGDIQVLAMIQSNANTEAEARDIAKGVNVVASGGEIHADGPSTGRRESWSVSYDIYVPRQTDLTLTANNGGVSIESVTSRISAETENGGLSLNDVHGDVQGRTVNGGISAELTGDRWIGGGLDLRTSNGGVRLTIPSNYSATLESGTVNGSLNVDFPMTVQGRIESKQFTTQLGAGGATVRATTTNGGVTIRRK